MSHQHISRRAFLGKFGKGTMAFAVFGLAACSDTAETTAAALSSTSTSHADTTLATSSPTTAATPTTTLPRPTLPGRLSYQRVALGNVSAYVLVRENAAAVVDTGNPGSAGDIEAALGAVGLGWDAVSDVILTHLHNDHVGSIGEVLGRAGSATAHAGAADIPSISSPRPLAAVGDGDDVFGLQIIETPGHTAGHISVFDPDTAVLVAGDALNGAEGGVIGPNPRFTADIPEGDASVRKLAALRPITILFGHGEPVEGGAAELLTALALDI